MIEDAYARRALAAGDALAAVAQAADPAGPVDPAAAAAVDALHGDLRDAVTSLAGSLAAAQEHARRLRHALKTRAGITWTARLDDEIAAELASLPAPLATGTTIDGVVVAPSTDLVPVADVVPSRTARAAVAVLPALPPADPTDRYSIRELTAAWLDACTSEHTARAFFGDLSRYLEWCVADGLAPLSARRADLDRYLAVVRARYEPRTAARRIASVSTWYKYLLANDAAGVTRNPTVGVKRPAVARLESPMAHPSEEQVDAMVAAAERAVATRAHAYTQAPTPGRAAWYLAALRDLALLRLLAGLGVRIDEALSLDIGSRTIITGYQAIKFIAKGAKDKFRQLPPYVAVSLDAYLTVRAEFAGCRIDELTGPLLATGSADRPGRLDEQGAHKTIRRLGKAAGIPTDRLAPHSLRGSWNAIARDLGATLEERQDAMGHGDPRTTRGYDRRIENIERDPAGKVGDALARRRAHARDTAPDPARDDETIP